MFVATLQALATCPPLEPLRSPRVAASSFSTANLMGVWYEAAYHDLAQAGARCQQLNTSITASGFDVNFRARYGPAPFSLTERYTREGSAAGVFIKRATLPGGTLVRLPTVVVDVLPHALTLFSCTDELPGHSTVSELVVATKHSGDDASANALQALARALGVPHATEARRVDWTACAAHGHAHGPLAHDTLPSNVFTMENSAA